MYNAATVFAAILCMVTICPSGINGAIVDPTTVSCGSTEYTWCNFDNGLIRGGSAPRKCEGQCICEGHTSFHGDNLDWRNGRCETPKDHACGTSTDGSMEIFCESGLECIAGRCREPDFAKLPARGKCRDDIECAEGLKCRIHFVKSPPFPRRNKRAIGPQYCCSAREAEVENVSYTLAELPCDK